MANAERSGVASVAEEETSHGNWPPQGIVREYITSAQNCVGVARNTHGFGLELHIDDHQGDDPWTSGRHAATSWTDGAFMHFALYETTDGAATTDAQIAFRVADIKSAHQRALMAGAEVLHAPKPQPWGQSARYLDEDGNIIELTQSA